MKTTVLFSEQDLLILFPNQIQTYVREMIHEQDKKLNPDRHRLTKDSYTREDTLHMCFLCSEHYEWSKQLNYDARTDRFYKKKVEIK